MMHLTKITRYGLAGVVLGVSIVSGGVVTTTHAQETEVKKPAATKRVPAGGRDPFRKYEVRGPGSKRVVNQVLTPSIEDRIAQYKAQKLAAMRARMVAPKPTTALLLSEMEVVGISRTPRGYAAIVEATPIKLSYVIYPGERFYDGQLVAIDENRLVFRREIVLTNGRRDRSVEIKPLRPVPTLNLMSATKTEPAVADVEKTSEQPALAAKPE